MEGGWSLYAEDYGNNVEYLSIHVCMTSEEGRCKVKRKGTYIHGLQLQSIGGCL